MVGGAVLIISLLRKGFFIFLALILQAAPALAWKGRVVSVADGDTFRVQQENGQIKIRVYGIDCPELDTEEGRRAKEFTFALVADKIVDIEKITIDKYGRTVAIIMVDGSNLSEELIRAGHARVFRRYCDRPVCRDWLRLEEQAKTAGRGLWQRQDAGESTPFWNWLLKRIY